MTRRRPWLNMLRVWLLDKLDPEGRWDSQAVKERALLAGVTLHNAGTALRLPPEDSITGYLYGVPVPRLVADQVKADLEDLRRRNMQLHGANEILHDMLDRIGAILHPDQEGQR